MFMTSSVTMDFKTHASVRRARTLRLDRRSIARLRDIHSWNLWVILRGKT